LVHVEEELAHGEAVERSVRVDDEGGSAREEDVSV
jgi:hypothetical protein